MLQACRLLLYLNYEDWCADDLILGIEMILTLFFCVVALVLVVQVCETTAFCKWLNVGNPVEEYECSNILERPLVGQLHHIHSMFRAAVLPRLRAGTIHQHNVTSRFSAEIFLHSHFLAVSICIFHILASNQDNLSIHVLLCDLGRFWVGRTTIAFQIP